eukprot:CAMPEP_0171454146 /NCGR_PEP_ID=MMETSP0945-20130129/1554_1 /TAXON_ID=109269 /ORGANISM="Vaucheria litorea, Strain CCMP2940" /LENGTH=274 /DNA_ID=CAMNT_0011979121 /DNA_START=36 /DNA_END=856 /DNA_ORIENTATION=-
MNLPSSESQNFETNGNETKDKPKKTETVETATNPTKRVRADYPAVHPNTEVKKESKAKDFDRDEELHLSQINQFNQIIQSNVPAQNAPPRQRRPKSNRPPTKRPLSAYNIFFSEERARLRSDPSAANLTFGQFGKIVAERWDKLPEEQKVELQTRAEQSRQAYFKQAMTQSPVYGAPTLLSAPLKGEKGVEIGAIRIAAKLLKNHANSIQRPYSLDNAIKPNNGNDTLWKEINSSKEPPPLKHGGRIAGHIYSHEVEVVLSRLGGVGARGGASP